MTEAAWLSATHPEPMLELLQGRATDRKLRLFGCFCCTTIWSLLSDERSRKAVGVAERFADGIASKDELEFSRQESRAAARFVAGLDYPSSYARRVAQRAAEAAAHTVGKSVLKVAASISRTTLEAAAEAAGIEGGWRGAYAEFRHRQLQNDSIRQCHSLHCIFGNPFQPAAFDATWRSETAVSLAAAIYAERAFDRLPILADALEEAGCDHADALTHCRGDGPHVRGCWVVDGVLGKS